MLTHGDSVEKVAENFKCIANSSSNIAGIANEKAHIYGLQFHPEVSGSFNFWWSNINSDNINKKDVQYI